jgi:hypothetical protein
VSSSSQTDWTGGDKYHSSSSLFVRSLDTSRNVQFCIFERFLGQTHEERIPPSRTVTSIPFHAHDSVQIQAFVNGLFTLHADQTRFKINVRDFLIELKEFAGQDNAELYMEEREASLQGGDFAERNGVGPSNGGKSMEDD